MTTADILTAPPTPSASAPRRAGRRQLTPADVTGRIVKYGTGHDLLHDEAVKDAYLGVA